MKKLNIKKITTLSVSALMLFGVGIGLINASSQTVQAREIISQYWDDAHMTSLDEAQSVMLDAGWSTKIPYNLNGKNSIKFHWYKKAQAKTVWNNTNVMPSIDWDAVEPDTGSGATTVLGYVTLNGRRYYITRTDDGNEPLHYNDGGIFLHLAEDFKTPTIMKAPHKIRTYDYGENGVDDDAYYVDKTHLKHQYFLVAPNAKPATLRMKNGKMKEFMPVTNVEKYGDEAGGCMITKEDYDTLVKTNQRVKYVYAYIQQKGNHITTTTMKYPRKIAPIQTRYFLKNSRAKKRIQKELIRKFKWVANGVAKGYNRNDDF